MPSFSSSQQKALESLARDLDEVFGPRLHALVAYAGAHGDGSVHSCALVDALAFQDLVKCLPFTGRWHQRRVAVPLMLS
jgi:23S rRNA-/tRNA-specific pseudouridylate synthase